MPSTIIQEISILYELSLSIGKTLDLVENSRNFLEVLIRRKNLSYAAVWIDKSRLPGSKTAGFELLYGTPKFRVAATFQPLDAPELCRLQDTSYFAISDTEESFDQYIREHNVQCGHYAYFDLEGIGFLKLYSDLPQSPFQKVELNKLRNVVVKFANSLKGGLSQLGYAHQLEETIKAREALEQSESNYRDLFDNMHDAILIQDENGNVIQGNSAACSLLELTSSQLVSSNIIDFIHPDDLNSWKEAARKLRRGDSHGEFSYRLVSKKGAIRFVEVSSYSILEEGEYQGSRDLLRDITARKLAENKIEKLAKFPEENPNPILRTNRFGIVEYANKASKLLMNELEVHKMGSLPQGLKLSIIDACRKGESLTKEIAIQGRNWMYQVSPFSQDGFAYLYFKDITDLKQAHMALKGSEKKIRAIINASLDAVISIDQNGRIIEWNKRAKEIFGWEIQEVFGKSIGEIIIPPKHREAHRKGMQRFLQTGYGPVLNKRIEIDALHKEGHEFQVELAISPIKLPGSNTHIFSAFARDISERKEMETRREKLMIELEKANNYLSDFAHVVSHDLKEPLRTISTLATWIQEDNEGILNEEGKEHFSLMLKNIVLMEDLIEGVLNYSKLGKRAEELTHIQVGAFLQELMESITVPSHIEVKVCGEFPLIRYNPIHLRQIFQNLISNAIKYNDKERGRVQIKVKDKQDYWEFVVRDNGKGIDAKYFEKIFHIFQSLDNKEDYETSGIGLSIVKKIVEIYGGRIWVSSTLGEGSTFYFTIQKELA